MTNNSSQQWYNGAAAEQKANSDATVGFILSLVSLVFLGFILAIPGIFFSSRAKRVSAANGQKSSQLAQAGVVIGWVSIALNVVEIIISIIVIAALAAAGHDAASCIANTQSAACH